MLILFTTLLLKTLSQRCCTIAYPYGFIHTHGPYSSPRGPLKTTDRAVPTNRFCVHPPGFVVVCPHKIEILDLPINSPSSNMFDTKLHLHAERTGCSREQRNKQCIWGAHFYKSCQQMISVAKEQPLFFLFYKIPQAHNQLINLWLLRNWHVQNCT